MSELFFESNLVRNMSLAIAFPLGAFIGGAAGEMIDAGVSPERCVTIDVDVVSTSGEVFQGPYEICNDTTEDGTFNGAAIGGSSITTLALTAAAADAVYNSRRRRRSADQSPTD